MLPGPKARNVIAWAGGPGNGCCFLWRPVRPKQMCGPIDTTGCGLTGRGECLWTFSWGCALRADPRLSHCGLSARRAELPKDNRLKPTPRDNPRNMAGTHLDCRLLRPATHPEKPRRRLQAVGYNAIDPMVHRRRANERNPIG